MFVHLVPIGSLGRKFSSSIYVSDISPIDFNVQIGVEWNLSYWMDFSLTFPSIVLSPAELSCGLSGFDISESEFPARREKTLDGRSRQDGCDGALLIHLFSPLVLHEQRT